MSRSDAVGARVAATDNENILALGGNALLVGESHAGQHTVLLREQLKGQMHAFQFTARSLEVACCGSACGKDNGIKSLTPVPSPVGEGSNISISILNT